MSVQRELSIERWRFIKQLAAREEAFKKEPSFKRGENSENKLSEKQEDIKRSSWDALQRYKIRDSKRSRGRRGRRERFRYRRRRITTKAGWLLLVWFRMDISRKTPSTLHTPSYSHHLLHPPSTLTVS